MSATFSTFLPVMESFYTIQGEGFYQGSAAYFIRLGGCDVGCFWCDVKDSWDADKHPKFSVAEILKKAETEIATYCLNQSSEKPIIVVTGGEPLLHNLEELTHAFKQNDFVLNIETSGSSPLSGSWNWICLSPKKFKEPLPEVIEAANELKVVIYNKSDFLWAEKYAALVSKNCRLYLQPEWSKSEEVIPMMIDYIKANPKWNLCLQIHKFINVP